MCTCMPGFTGRSPISRSVIMIDSHVTCDKNWIRLLISRSGAKCEIDIDECNSAPCQNGGLCKDGMGDFQCQCKPGFLGKGTFEFVAQYAQYLKQRLAG